ncbi:unnamed protein product [Parascedosporium putredinis]|uniref:FAD-binding domain-containing protein n=1 Tax=Parascedosporium putredinis TaxID=1442378 RepID=A0A9P1GTY4_9PEZI|nr:unnamed protein product [Parascedosporium putredinis]CAI7987288.1 unnamed protein product [Parascedosporium putredinis]
MTGDVCPEEGLRVLVIGAGLAGLAVAISTKLANPAHQVTILEAAKALQEIGAALQMTPNATRLLEKWSVLDALRPDVIEPRSLTVRRYDGTEVLAHEGCLREVMEENYCAPFWNVHRVDLQRELVRRCRELGVRIELGRRAVRVDFAKATVVLAASGHMPQKGGRESDEVMAAEVGAERESLRHGDVVICAEGLWSSTRAQFLGAASPNPSPTGDIAYRICLHTKDLRGPHRDEIAAFARSEAALHVGLLMPDDDDDDSFPPGTIRADADPAEMRAQFAAWDPFLARILSEVDSVQRWRLLWLEAPADWTSPDGRFFMLGDACHPMLPYLAQGANSALEDGAVLGHLLGKIRNPDAGSYASCQRLPAVAAMYQALRSGRGAEIQREAFAQRHDFHLPDGERQAARDEIFRTAARGDWEPGTDDAFPSRWTCPRVQKFLYGYDAYAEAEALYQKNPF